MKRQPRGFSLIELLVCLAVMAILAASSANFTGILAKSRAEEALNTLRTLCGFVKSEAIIRGEPVTLCGSVDGSTCTNVWASASALVFVDRNHNGNYDSNIDTLLRQEALNHRILWHGGANSRYMRAFPGGYLAPWGSYIYCPPQGNSYKGRQLVLNRLGRSYESQSLDPAMCDEQI